MGVFEFIVVLVIVGTAGKVVSQRFGREQPRGHIPDSRDFEGIRETLDDLTGRVVRLEEERDFYKDLLESPERQRDALPSGGDASLSETD